MESFEQFSSMCRHPLERPAAGVWFGKKFQDIINSTWSVPSYKNKNGRIKTCFHQHRAKLLYLFCFCLTLPNESALLIERAPTYQQWKYETTPLFSPSDSRSLGSGGSSSCERSKSVYYFTQCSSQATFWYKPSFSSSSSPAI